MKAHWDEDVAILSAENVSFAVETAGLGSRLAAVCVDMMLQGLAFVLLSLALTAATPYIPIQVLPMTFMAVLSGGGFFLFYVYFFVFEWLWAGQTPGKRVAGLRVIHANGLPVTWWPVFLRNLLRVIDFLPFGYGVGGLVAVSGPHNQRVGDVVAGTIVARVRRDANQKPILGIGEAVDAFLAAREAPTAKATVKTETNPHLAAAEAPAAALDPERAALRIKLSQEDAELVREFLQRRATMPSAVRARLAQSLAQRISAKLGHAPPPDAQNEAMLEYIARAFYDKGS